MEHLDRRIPFFLVAAVASFGLRFVLLDSEEGVVKIVPIAVGIIYLVLAALFQLEWLARRSESNADAAHRSQHNARD